MLFPISILIFRTALQTAMLVCRLKILITVKPHCIFHNLICHIFAVLCKLDYITAIHLQHPVRVRTKLAPQIGLI